MNAPQDLLYGVIAHRMGLIDAQQFAQLCQLRTSGSRLDVEEFLRSRGWISEAEAAQVTQLVQRFWQETSDQGATLRSAVATATLAGSPKQANWQEAQQSAREMFSTVDSYLARSLGQHDTVHSDADHTRADSPNPPKIGSRYEVKSQLGQGGLGTVWLAYDRILNRDVAIKEIRSSEVVDLDARLVQEAQVTGQLEHPSIVPVYDLSLKSEDGKHFYSMRVIRGETLWDAIQALNSKFASRDEKALEQRRLLNAFCSVCQAIAYAHVRGVLHRDLKPENVVLGSFGEVQVVDWGVAKLMGEVESLPEGSSEFAVSSDSILDQTQLGSVVGTPTYISYEQAEGDPNQIDARTDIFGLGAILFAILTGEAPWRGETQHSILWKVGTSDGPPLARSVRPSVPAALEAVCAKAMAKSKTDRYESAADLADDVQRWLADKPVSAHRESWFQQSRRWARQHGGWLEATAGTMIAVTVLAILGSVAFHLQAQSARALEEDHQTKLAKLDAKLQTARSDYEKAVQEHQDYLKRPQVTVAPTLRLKPGEQTTFAALVDRRNLEAELKAHLEGLPHGVTAEPANVAPHQKNARFEVTVAEIAPFAHREVQVVLTTADQTNTFVAPVQLTIDGPTVASILDRAKAEYATNNSGEINFINAAGSSLSEAQLAYLPALPRLKRLNLRGLDLSAAGLTTLAGCEQLELLLLDETPVTDDDLVHLKKLEQLEGVGLGSTQVTGSGLEHLASLRKLRSIGLNELKLSSVAMLNVGKLTQLEELWLPRAGLTDTDLSYLQSLKELEKLNLASNDVGDAGMQHLKKLTKLKFLILNSTQVGDVGLSHLAEIDGLRFVALYDTQVTRHGVGQLARKLPKCQITLQPPCE